MPLMFDLPFEQLADYNGMNPRPDDFDVFWDSALSEMKAVKPEIELVPADFKTSFCKCEDLYFTGVGGARIHAKLLKPLAAKSPGPAILMFHGYSMDAGDWTDKLGYVAQGFTVAAMDCRGQGGSSEDPGGVSGNTLHGHIIRGLQDALNGSPGKTVVPADLPGYGPTGRHPDGPARGGRRSRGGDGRQPGRRPDGRLCRAGTAHPQSCADVSLFK